MCAVHVPSRNPRSTSPTSNSLIELTNCGVVIQLLSCTTYRTSAYADRMPISSATQPLDRPVQVCYLLSPTRIPTRKKACTARAWLSTLCSQRSGQVRGACWWRAM